MKRLLGLLFLVGSGALLAMVLPDIKHYMRIRAM
jgi:hypothetical protein